MANKNIIQSFYFINTSKKKKKTKTLLCFTLSKIFRFWNVTYRFYTVAKYSIWMIDANDEADGWLKNLHKMDLPTDYFIMQRQRKTTEIQC